VLNYAPWGIFEQRERIALLRYGVRWICKNRQWLDLGNGRHILPILRISPDKEQFALMLTNAWMDTTYSFRVKVRGSFGTCVYYTGPQREKTECIVIYKPRAESSPK